MRVVVQRVKEASVTAEDYYESIQKGLVLLVGIYEYTTQQDIHAMAKKLVAARIFEDDQQKMNLSIKDVGGSILSISQFTLCADVKKGNRPSFTSAMQPQKANQLYEMFNDALINEGLVVKPGVFGADMDIQIINDGPVTIIYDSNEGRIQ